MCFLMAMEEEPVRSLSSAMAAKIPALYDIVDDFLNCRDRSETVGRVESAPLESYIVEKAK